MFFDDLESLYWLRCRFAVEGDGIKREICIGWLRERLRKRVKQREI